MADAAALRIVHAVRSDLFAGVERSMLLSATALVDRGHQVSVIGGDESLMCPQLSEIGVPWRPATSTLDVARALWLTGRVDIVHAHMTAAESAAVLTRLRNRGRFVVTRHFAQRRGSTAWGRVAALVIDRVPHTEVAISSFVEGLVGVPSLVVYHGVADRELVQGSGRQVVVIQRLEREKHTDVAVRAWACSSLGDEGWELVIAGEGADRSALESLARELGVAGSVRFLGRVADVDVLRAAAALQLASPPNEHFGLSVLEAMSVGLPVLAADGGAHRELLGDEHDALFPAGDIERAAAGLRRLAHDPQMRREMGRRLRQRQQHEFSLAAHGEALEAVYRRALHGTTDRLPPARHGGSGPRA